MLCALTTKDKKASRRKRHSSSVQSADRSQASAEIWASFGERRHPPNIIATTTQPRLSSTPSDLLKSPTNPVPIAKSHSHLFTRCELQSRIYLLSSSGCLAFSRLHPLERLRLCQEEESWLRVEAGSLTQRFETSDVIGSTQKYSTFPLCIM